MAVEVFKSNVRLQPGRLLCEATVRGFKVQMDEPETMGGTDQAMNPVELLLCALGGCLCICAGAFSKAARVDLTAFEVNLEGDLDPDGFMGKNKNVRTGFQGIRAVMKITSKSPQENLEKMIQMIKTVCPVSDTLKGVDVKADYEIKHG